jgi:hypothetical protein
MNQLYNSDKKPTKYYPTGLHESDPFWDFDEEANDTRPNSEKYTNAPLVILAMILILLGLGFGLMYIMNHIS